MAQNPIIPPVIKGSFVEPYTPAVGRITSYAANPKGQGAAPVKIQSAKFILSNAANVTFVSYAGTLISNFPLKAGLFRFPVKEIQSVSVGTVNIVHDGQLCVDEEQTPGSGTPALQYLAIPSAPFSTGFARPVAGLNTPGELFGIDLGNTGPVDFILDGAFINSLDINGIKGTEGVPYRGTNKDNNTIIGTLSAVVSAFNDTNSSTNIEWYGKDSTTPLRLLAGSGNSAVILNADVSLPSITLQNFLAKDIGYTFFLASNGDFTSNSGYGTLVEQFCRIDGLVTEGEGTHYVGHNGSPYGFTELVVALHNSSRNKGREGMQFQHVKKYFCFNHTHINSGQYGLLSDLQQANLFQIHNSIGRIENCIFDGGPLPFNLFTHDMVVKNCYIRYQTDTTHSVIYGFAGRTDNSYFAGSPNLDGVEILFDGCDFVCDNGGGNVAYMMQFAERGANIRFINCTFTPNILSIVSDQRVAGFTNTITATIGSNGNTYSSSVPQPTYASVDPESPDYLKVTSTYHYNKGRGYRTLVTGNLVLVQGLQNVPIIAIPNGTSFATLQSTYLPSTAMFRAQDGSLNTFAVTWAQGTYDGTTAGSYRLSGTPTVSGSIVNTYSVASSILVTVAAPISSSKVVVANFGGASLGFITGQNYNHVKSSGTGDQVIYGENTGDIQTTGFKKTDGTGQTTIRVSIQGAGVQGEQVGQNTAGTGFNQPGSFNLDEWSAFTGGGTLSMKFTGLTIGKSYTLDVVCSSGNFLGNPQNLTLTISGAASGNTTTSTFSSWNNVNTFQTFVITPNATTADFTLSGTGAAGVVPRISGVRFSFTEP